MGEVTHLKVSLPKPRPLGLVKRESVHFDNEDTDTDVEIFPDKHKSWSRGSLAFLGRSKTESDLKHEFRSMRDLQETLRQAALLNIVAAVNHDDRPVDTVAVPTRTSGGQGNFVGIKGASILGHTFSRPTTKSFVSAGSGEGISICNFSHNLSSSAVNMPLTPHSSTLSHLLGQRPRTISIPRPRTQCQNDQSAFMHNSLLDAKEQLSNVTTFRAKSRKEMDPSVQNNYTPPTLTGDSTPTAGESKAYSAHGNNSEPKNGIHGNKSESRNGDFARSVSCVRGTGFDIGDSSQRNKHAKEGNSLNVLKDNNTHQNGDTHTAKLSKDQQRAQNVHQMQVLKRHISTSKKKELMKKLTSIAKCEAVDIAEPLSSVDVVSAPPIIIMSHYKDNSPLYADGLETRSNGAKSMTSLQGRDEDNNVPSNNRFQSETFETIGNYRETKKKNILNVEEDLRIGSINGIERATGVDGLYRTHRDQKVADTSDDPEYMFMDAPHSNQLFSEGIVGKTVPPSFSPDVLELRPLEGLSNINSRVTLVDRRRPNISRRSFSQGLRENLMSPSPAVYEASFHKPKASMVQMTMVGQSLPTLPGPKTPAPSAATPTKPVSKRSSIDNTNATLRDEYRTEEGPNKQAVESSKTIPRPWGSIGKQTSVNSPILRTEIVDHLQCVGLVNHRQMPTSYRKSLSKVNGINKSYGENKYDFEFDDEEDYEDDVSSENLRVNKNTAKYRKSKLYNAFRASEENLSTLVDNSALVSEVITSRTLLNPQTKTVAEEPPCSPSPRDRVNQSTKEPLYMGCSSRVSERELRSQYHYVNDVDEEEAKQGGQFKVMKALDQDVYFDFQHKKYRKNNETALNTAPDNPRMHFLKIKFGAEATT